MLKIIERIKAGVVHAFHGGVHPPEQKDQSSHNAILTAPLPPKLILPLRQHAGEAGDLLVKVGDRVLKGQPLTRYHSGRSLPIHAPTSGVIAAIDMQSVPHPSGLSELCITLESDGEDRWIERNPHPDYHNLNRSELLTIIQSAGVAGLGGAVFPTHAKLGGHGQLTELLIINGMECEPYITTDDRLMRDYAAEIHAGIAVLKHMLKPRLTIIGIENNKPEAIKTLRQEVEADLDVVVRTCPVLYPSGGAKQTIEILTGRQVPKGGRAVEIGVLVLNVATVFAIKRAVIDGEPLIERLVTLTGERIAQKGNVWARLGTPVGWLLEQFGFSPEAEQRLIMGGPMMGLALPHLNVPVVKATNCLLAPSLRELPPPQPESPCIRCGACSNVCPMSLLPQELYWQSRQLSDESRSKLAELHLSECIECGSCAYVCPSRIPLVSYYRQAKDDIRVRHEEKAQAERARLRFEAKQARIAREKSEREAKAKAAVEARRAQLAVEPNKQEQIAAALARAKAVKAVTIEPSSGEAAHQALMAQRAARRAEALEKRSQGGAVVEPAASETATAPSEVDPKKAALAAAIARAKAKKAAQASGESSAEVEQSSVSAVEPIAVTEAPTLAEEVDPKKAAIAAAIARAKAKKAAQASGESSAEVEQSSASAVEPIAVTEVPTPAVEVDPKKAAIAAAIARAKAKKAAQASGESSAEVEQSSASAVEPIAVTEAPTPAVEVDPKKAAIAAAIARAKAKKAAQAATQTLESKEKSDGE